MQLRGCEFITEEEKTTLRVGEKVHPWESTCSMENNTLLAEHAATEYGSGEMCLVSLYANGHGIRGIAIHGWASNSAKINEIQIVNTK